MVSKKNVCYLFPGQGAQYVGMGREMYEHYQESRDVLNQAEKILADVNIKRLCFEGPIEELTQTANSQVAILVVSVATLKVLNFRIKDELDVVSCAGLSLGELTSLVAARCIEFQDAVRLVRRRGELMEQASMKNPGSMVSVIGLPLQDLKEVCNDAGVSIANLNCPGQIVISGTKQSIEKAIKLAAKKGAKKVFPLNVSGAFHSPLMREAAELFKLELDKVKFSNPKIDIVSNVTADYEKTPEQIKKNLFEQLFSTVRWEESIRKIASQGIDTFFEIGPGKVLKNLLRRIDTGFKVYNIEKTKDIEDIVQLCG